MIDSLAKIDSRTSSSIGDGLKADMKKPVKAKIGKRIKLQEKRKRICVRREYLDHFPAFDSNPCIQDESPKE